jgi:hypothetical protein
VKGEFMKVDAESLISWINLNKVEDGGVTPPPVVYSCTKCPLTFSTQELLDAHMISAHSVTPPVSGKYKEAVKGAYKLNTTIRKPDGTLSGIGGMGFYQNMTPGAAYCPGGRKTYFLADLAWKGSFGTKSVKWVNNDVTGPAQSTIVIKLDANDDGVVYAGPSLERQSYFAVGNTGRYLIEVETIADISLSIYW